MQQTQINKVIELGVAQTNINSRDLGLAVAAMAQEAARNRLRNAGMTVVATADGGNTGDGTVTVAANPAGPGAIPGEYVATCTAEAGDGGTFEVTDPNGVVVGEATVGTLFEGPIRFTIADGSSDWDADDFITFSVATATEAALTDNSGGTAGSALGAVTVPTAAAVDNVVSMAPKAAFDTQIGLIEDAHGEIASALNVLISSIAGVGYPNVDDFSEAAAADGTIAAITVALTGTTADDEGVPAADGKAQIVTARNNQALLCSALNFVRVAVGLSVITDNSGGMFTKGSDGSWDGADAAATGTAAANGADSLTDATVDAALAALRTNIATLAAEVNAVRTSLAVGPFVIATHNPNWKFQNADVTA